MRTYRRAGSLRQVLTGTPAGAVLVEQKLPAAICSLVVSLPSFS